MYFVKRSRVMQIMVIAKEQGKKFGIAEPDQSLATEIVVY